MRSCSADQNAVALFANIRKTPNAGNINQQLRLRQSQLHSGNETMPTSELFGAIRVPCQESNRFIDCVCNLVIELCGNHLVLLLLNTANNPPDRLRLHRHVQMSVAKRCQIVEKRYIAGITIHLCDRDMCAEREGKILWLEEVSRGKPWFCVRR